MSEQQRILLEQVGRVLVVAIRDWLLINQVEFEKNALTVLFTAEKTGVPLTSTYCESKIPGIIGTLKQRQSVCVSDGYIVITKKGIEYLKKIYPKLALGSVRPYNVELSDQKLSIVNWRLKLKISLACARWDWRNRKCQQMKGQ